MKNYFNLCTKLLFTTVICISISTLSLKKTAYASRLSDQITNDLIGAGVSIGAALSGSVPLALVSGYLVKYITTYGVAGIKSLIDQFKEYTPQELGELNILYIYLISTKRNLYQALETMKKSVERDLRKNQKLREDFHRIESLVSDRCQSEQGCEVTAIDDMLVNFHYVNIAVDGKMTLDINEYLSHSEIKNTYQYLMLLYLDTLIVEQKIINAQKSILAKRAIDTIDLIKDNPYLSQAEKEYQTQLILSLSLRWELMSTKRKIIMAKAVEGPLDILRKENAEIEDDIQDYADKYKKKRRWGKR